GGGGGGGEGGGGEGGRRPRAPAAGGGASAEAAPPRRCHRPGGRGGPSRSSHERRRLYVLAHPQLEHQQTPEAMPVIGTPGLVVVEQPRDLCRTEPAAVVREDVARELTQVFSEPAAERDAEARLSALCHPRRELACERAPA